MLFACGATFRQCWSAEMRVSKLLKLIARKMTPPLLWCGMRSLVHIFPSGRSGKMEKEPWGKKSAEWYDTVYENSAEYHRHYSESIYYFLWTVVVDRMMHYRIERVLDLGCGPGQFGSLLYDKGFREYVGVDLSTKCVDIAKQTCPMFEFVVANILETNILESRDYDCLVALEFLEHVEDDLEVLRKAKAGTKFFGTVPNFPYVSHVRHFSSAKEVKLRYKSLFSSFRVDSFLRDPKGTMFYLIEGTKL